MTDYTTFELPLRFVFGDRTIDTERCLRVAISRTADETTRNETVLYKTPSGDFFLHHHAVLKSKRGKPFPTDDFRALTPDEAVRWLAESRAILLDAAAGGLPLPPNA